MSCALFLNVGNPCQVLIQLSNARVFSLMGFCRVTVGAEKEKKNKVNQHILPVGKQKYQFLKSACKCELHF